MPPKQERRPFKPPPVIDQQRILDDEDDLKRGSKTSTAKSCSKIVPPPVIPIIPPFKDGPVLKTIDITKPNIFLPPPTIIKSTETAIVNPLSSSNDTKPINQPSLLTTSTSSDTNTKKVLVIIEQC